MSKRPSFQFYPSDYLNDLRLRQCSAAARGIWVDMFCLMNQGTPYGHLRDEAGDISIRSLARVCGVTTRALGVALAELESHQVFSRTETGTIFSRRMVRDEELRTARAQGGFSSSKNPNVPRKKQTEGSKHYHPSNEKKDILQTIPFRAEDEDEEVVGLEIKKIPPNGKTTYDPIPGWQWFSEEYPKHRLNPHMDSQLWLSVVDSSEVERLIREKLPRFKASVEWCEYGGRMVPKASNFLGERRFLMEPGPSISDKTPHKKSRHEEILERL